ncbi:nuclear transport factor 2 family protein [Salinimicrobium xinjiangense]|uniref:nuclear transport factor 2 family protein n=1 Tax=Salinimicrobium xinjiangense TaxID=438596 RepID=UPI0003FC7A3E|nr:nuclear transport factor 2 family protein [Salinimicrobium xinjiangense]
MKTTFQFAIIFMSMTTFGQTSEKTDEEQIKELIEKTFQEIFSDYEPQALDTCLTEDFLLLETGEVWDMEKMRSYVERSGERRSTVKRLNYFDFIEIKIEGKMAWVAYHNNAKFKQGEEIVREMNWIESATAILTDEGWKLQMLHSTVKQ